MADQKRVVLGVTGSIAAYKSAEIIRRLQDHDIHVSVAMTKAAEKFITPLTLSSLANEEVYRDYFQESSSGWKMPHISLAREADLVLIAPATADIIGKYANGLADDILTCILLATTSPVMMAPAMNTEMYNNRFVQANCAKLKEAGVSFVEPVDGNLACGETGTGHIAEVEEIISAALKVIK